MSKLKISLNISSLVACENENKGCLFDLFLHICPILSMLYFKITLKIGLETFSNRESLWSLYSGILRFFTMFEKKEFSDSAIWLSSEIVSSFALLKLSCPKGKVSLLSKKFCYR